MRITDKQRLDFMETGTQVIECTVDDKREFFVWDYATSEPTKKYYKRIRQAIDAAIKASRKTGRRKSK